ncbi:MAG: YbhB/YbcL family Raf kinase inhibitor-like protein [Propionibacteriaceae bacterium]|jgi:Raf kinase inhibitor-like YbhB/YbcL family protein|nr:YbhB/YbcL family Raf kinase inhibitor-like protein [Propionibacteriaceae bacterium]
MDLHARPVAPDPYDLLPPVPSFVLTSVDFTDGAALPAAHAADGGNFSPCLRWTGFPADAQSFAVTCFDPDTPTPAGWWHWSLVNVPATTTCLGRGLGAPGGAELPPGSFHVRTDSGQAGYFGAAPPPGDRPHRYIFAVHALDVPRLDVGPDASPTLVAFQTVFATIARARLTGLYQR